MISAADVKVLFSEITITDDNITKYIDDAEKIIDKYLGDKISDLQLLEKIKKYTAAHFIALTVERQKIDEKVGDVQVKYNQISEIGFKATTYGQIACDLDYTGTLNKLSEQKSNFKFIVT